MAEFVIPEFLQNRSPEDFLKKIVSILPADIDFSEGGHAYNLTAPAAMVAAELCEFILPEVIKIIFPEWSYGSYLDGHAKGRGITRRPAAAATGEITITGAANTAIPAGSLFSTASVNDEPGVDYETLEYASIPVDGSVTVSVRCTRTGVVGNAAANTIVLVSSKLTGITAVTNEAPLTGGTEEEDDASLVERITEYDKSQGDSYVGSAADYKRWATSVAGVGEATVISATDDTGLVTIILTDANGDAATDALCEAVYNYIMRPDDPGERLAPVNALLSVVPPATMAIAISATVELEEGATTESVQSAFMAKLAQYLPAAMDDREIKHTKISAALSAAAGVSDFSGLLIGVKGGALGTANIPITTTQLPTVDPVDLSITSGAV